MVQEPVLTSLPVRKLLRAVWELEEKGDRLTLLGIGPMSRRVIRASLEVSRDMDFPVFFIASRNQVDSDRFGGGYVAGWDQKRFVKAILSEAQKVGYEGPLYICRDHGGPWQRDEERVAKLPLEEAMERGKASYAEDISAGFNFLHIDPTKNPHFAGKPPFDWVIERAVELIGFCEGRIEGGAGAALSYEVGTEETAGGLIDEKTFGRFLEEICQRLDARSLPRPNFIVGQTGTLVRGVSNVGRFDPNHAGRLAQIAKSFGVGFKEHNADYMSEEEIELHPRVGITAANVAPEFGLAETEALLELAEKESELIRDGADIQLSGFGEALTEAVVESGRWKKWLTKDKEGTDEAALRRDQKLLSDMVRACGHYVFENAEVKAAEERMYENLRALGAVADPEGVVLDGIKAHIRRYAEPFGLSGSWSKLKRQIEKEM